MAEAMAGPFESLASLVAFFAWAPFRACSSFEELELELLLPSIMAASKADSSMSWYLWMADFCVGGLVSVSLKVC